MKHIYQELLRYKLIESNDMISFLASKSNIIKDITREQHRLICLWKKIDKSALVIQCFFRKRNLFYQLQLSLLQLPSLNKKLYLNEFTFCQEPISKLRMKYVYKYLIIPDNRYDYFAYRYYVFDLRELASMLKHNSESDILLNPYTGIPFRSKDIRMITQLITQQNIQPVDHENPNDEKLSLSSRISRAIAQLSNLFLEYNNYTKLDYLLYLTKTELIDLVREISHIESIDSSMDIERYYTIILARYSISKQELTLKIIEFLYSTISAISDKERIILAIGVIIENTFYYQPEVAI